MSRILVLINNAGGLSSFRKEVLERFIKDGHEVFFSCPNDDKVDIIKELGCKYEEATINRHGTNIFEELKLISYYENLIKKINPDVVLTYTIKPNVYGGMACKKLKVPYIENITGLGGAVVNGGLMQKITLTLYKIALKKAKVVFFQNKDNQEFMLNKGIVKTEYKLLPGSGVNLQHHTFNEYPKFNNYEDKFLFIGRIMKDKGIDEFLQAAEKIKKEYPKVSFTIIGGFDDDYKEKIDSYVNNGTVVYLGPQNDVRPFIRDCSAVINPSYHEGMSNVLLEASAGGRPVLASNIPGCMETFDEEKSGIGFEVKNSESLYNAIKKFIELDYDKKVQMGKYARQKVEKEFNRQIVVDAYIKEINSL